MLVLSCCTKTWTISLNQYNDKSVCILLMSICIFCCIVVVESHPDNAHEDLRLDRPFPALVEFCDSLELDAMSKKVPNQ